MKSLWRSLPQPEVGISVNAGHELRQPLEEEASMIAEIDLLDVWIPEQMQPGTIFLLEHAGELGKAENPYWAVLACPSCGSLGLITRQQCAGLDAMICGSSDCSAEYFLEDQAIRYRLAN
jgi:hypothetical protein